jgi:RNA polymerase sigma-70 factor (ECF subfamily)
MPKNDAQLLQDVRRGDEGAFLSLYRLHRTPLFRFAWRLTGSTAAAEDVVQECFLKLIEGAAFDANLGSLRAYLFGITRNLALKHVRTVWSELEDMEVTASPLDGLLSAERSEIVARAVAALPPGQREVLILFEYEELSLEEVAQAVGIETGAVKARLHRARETLRRRLDPLLPNAASKEERS